MKKTHGLSGSPEYLTWSDMKKRCYKPTKAYYQNYGGRGIRVCDEWLNDFQRFLDDMGNRPTPKHTIDRIDNSKDYTPENCRWSTRKEQMNNFSRNHLVTHGDMTLTFSQWADRLGLKYKTIVARFQRGWDTDRALAPTLERSRK